MIVGRVSIAFIVRIHIRTTQRLYPQIMASKELHNEVQGTDLSIRKPRSLRKE